MSFLDAAAFSVAPVLAAALIQPRVRRASYVAFVIAAAVIGLDYNDRYDGAAFGDIFSTLSGMLVVAALLAGLATRWALKRRPRQTDRATCVPAVSRSRPRCGLPARPCRSG